MEGVFVKGHESVFFVKAQGVVVVFPYAQPDVPGVVAVSDVQRMLVKRLSDTLALAKAHASSAPKSTSPTWSHWVPFGKWVR